MTSTLHGLVNREQLSKHFKAMNKFQCISWRSWLQFRYGEAVGGVLAGQKTLMASTSAMDKISAAAVQEPAACRPDMVNKANKKEVCIINSSIGRFTDLKYTLIGPPSYQMFKHVMPLYDDLYKLVEHMQDPSQLAIAEVRDRLTRMVNDLSGVVDDSCRGIEQGLASLQAAVEKTTTNMTCPCLWGMMSGCRRRNGTGGIQMLANLRRGTIILQKAGKERQKNLPI